MGAIYRLLVLVSVLSLAGCTTARPSPAGSTRSIPPAVSPSPPSLSSVAPGTGSTLSLTTGTIDQRSTTPALAYASTGEYLVWSSGARIGATAKVAPDLFTAVPGGAAQLLYANPNRDSELRPIGGHRSSFAFIEENFRAFGYGGWKLWYIPRPGAKAVEIDRGVMSVVPNFSISGKWLAWTPGPGDMSELVVVDLTTMRRRVLLSSPAQEAQYWHPAIDGDRLVYGTVELAVDRRSDQRHVYLLNLAAEAPPRRLDHSVSASEPAIHGDDVVWKESDPSLNFVVSGSLTHYSLKTNRSQPLLLKPGPQPTINGYGVGWTQPSVGNRYVAAWSDSGDGDRAMYLADLRGGGVVKIVDLGPTVEAPHDVVVRPVLSGDLLAYVFGPAKGNLQLRWVSLR
ncbi:MAG: hypothetical protein DLM71_00280 [Chloroflexi bacterium]|nr:MAG: hypothetical protein DLM71_00280 [Chloroflexota bacterium]